jgi:dephospho-CoA kinase
MAEAPTDAIVVMDVPLLVESKTAAERGYEAVLVVEAPRATRLDRLEARGIERADAEARMSAQATDEERRAIATYVLDNAGDEQGLETQVDEVWADLARRHAEKAQPQA